MVAFGGMDQEVDAPPLPRVQKVGSLGDDQKAGLRWIAQPARNSSLVWTIARSGAARLTHLDLDRHAEAPHRPQMPSMRP